MAHKAVGGPYTGAVNYTYTYGPDGKRYISGGEVSIDVSPERDLELIQKKYRENQIAESKERINFNFAV